MWDCELVVGDAGGIVEVDEDVEDEVNEGEGVPDEVPEKLCEDREGTCEFGAGRVGIRADEKEEAAEEV